MNISGASTATNLVTTSTLAANNSTSTAITKSFTGTYTIKSLIVGSKRPTSGILYPRYS